MEDSHLALRFAVAIGLGMLLGLERERSKVEDGGAGVRTFALIALSGALAGHLGKSLGLDWLAGSPWPWPCCSRSRTGCTNSLGTSTPPTSRRR